MSSATKYLLEESQMPRAWYNIQADLPKALPPVLHPGTLQPVGPSDLAPLFPMELILQEVSQEREMEIPEPVREIYRLWRPAPLYRAHRLEKALGTPAKIFYKYEGVSPAGSHKPNTAVPQAFYNAAAGIKRLTTETGAGQWGTSLSFAGFARHEGIVPAPEANHAVKGAIEEAMRCKREGKSETILFNLCGHGHFDMTAYQKYFAGELKDESYSEEELAMALAGLPSVPAGV